MLPAVRMYLVLLAMGCAGTQHAPHATTGAIAGLARDRTSGDPVARASIHVRADGELAARAASSAGSGAYAVDHLPPGQYSLSAEFAGQPIDVEHIAVRAGETTVVDLPFTLGKPDRIRVDFGNPEDGAIARYRPPRLAP